MLLLLALWLVHVLKNDQSLAGFVDYMSSPFAGPVVVTRCRELLSAIIIRRLEAIQICHVCLGVRCGASSILYMLFQTFHNSSSHNIRSF